MYSEYYEDMTNDEVTRMNLMFGDFWKQTHRKQAQYAPDQDSDAQLAHVISCDVERCFVQPNFNDEHPLYVLDAGSQRIVILFGQWLYDPNISTVADEVFEAWNSSQSFFAHLILRREPTTGTVLRFDATPPFVATAAFSATLPFKQLQESQTLSTSIESFFDVARQSGLIA